MSKKRKKHTVPEEQSSSGNKKAAKANALRLLALIAVTMLIFCTYRFLLDFYYFEIVLGIYMAVAATVIFTYVIYNRGFSRRGVTKDMLPDTMTDEEKTEFIEDAERRLRKSRPLLVLIIAFSFTFVVDILELYALPLIQEIFGI